MTLSVIGAGAGRTGTHTLKLALEQLGLGPCYHMRDIFEHLDTDVPVWIAPPAASRSTGTPSSRGTCPP